MCGHIVFSNLLGSSPNESSPERALDIISFSFWRYRSMVLHCVSDVLVNLHLHCEQVVMVFYFGFTVLCVLLLCTYLVTFYLLQENMWKPHRLLKPYFCCFRGL